MIAEAMASRATMTQGAAPNAIELRAIERAWDRVSHETQQEFIANLKERGWQ